MKNEFVPYEQSLDLKELGFDDPCFGFYVKKKLFQVSDSIYVKEDWSTLTNTDLIETNKINEVITSPLYQQAFSWFIENHNLYGDILPWSVKKLVDNKLVEKIVWYYSVEILGKPSRYKPYEFTGETPEEAKLECLKKLIEVIKER